MSGIKRGGTSLGEGGRRMSGQKHRELASGVRGEVPVGRFGPVRKRERVGTKVAFADLKEMSGRERSNGLICFQDATRLWLKSSGQEQGAERLFCYPRGIFGPVAFPRLH